MKYQRAFAPGATFFFTLVTYQRRPIFSSPEAVELLRFAIRKTMDNNPFLIVASVILPDHMHFIWTLPPGDSDYSTRWRLIKSNYTRIWWHKSIEAQLSLSREKKGGREVWQRRFWEHLLRNETDLSRHIEYIHFNPVKQGLVKSPYEWEYSSFKKYGKNGIYSSDWGDSRGV